MPAAAAVSGDALEDDLYLEDDALSDRPAADEGNADDNKVDAPPAAEKRSAKKRKRDDARTAATKKGRVSKGGKGAAVRDSEVESKADAKDGPKQKGKRKAKPSKTLPAASVSAHEDVSIGLHPPDVQSLYLGGKQERALPKVSDLELDSLRIQLSWLADLTGVDERAHLGAWLAKDALPGLVEAVKTPTAECGSPTVLVVAGAALRVADLCRELKPLLADSAAASGGVAKLFARHLKLSEHVAQLESHPVSIAVGTPDRLGKLLEAGALKTDRLRWIVVDVTWVDGKKYCLVDLPDIGVRRALWKSVLGHAGLRRRLAEKQAVIALF